MGSRRPVKQDRSDPDGDDVHSALLRLLASSRALGFLGDTAIEDQIRHARRLAVGIGHTDRVLDLGSGGGLPGLVVAADRLSATVVLLDGMVRRTTFLREAARVINELGGHVEVVTERAEVAGRSPTLRGTFDFVVARSFGPPAVTAECGAPFLRRGGQLIVSEPPGGHSERWPAEGLRELGLRLVALEVEPIARVVLLAEEPCPDRFPRRVGVPTRRPVFHVEHDR